MVVAIYFCHESLRMTKLLHDLFTRFSLTFFPLLYFCSLLSLKFKDLMSGDIKGKHETAYWARELHFKLCTAFAVLVEAQRGNKTH